MFLFIHMKTRIRGIYPGIFPKKDQMMLVCFGFSKMIIQVSLAENENAKNNETTERDNPEVTLN